MRSLPALSITTALLLSACGDSGNTPGSDNPTTGPAPTAAELPRDCFWATRSDANAANVLYPDRYATYWVAALAVPPGAALRLEGRYPHARYMSFNLYNPRLEPLDALADVEISPNAGSAQPFAVNALRTAEPRNYTVQIVPGARPTTTERAANTLYSFQAIGPVVQPSNIAFVIYRLYVEDAGRDITGGVGLPTVVLTTAAGQELRGNAACSALEQLPLPDLSSALNSLDPAADPTPNTAAFKHLQWLKFFDLQAAQANRFNATPLGPPIAGNFGQSQNNAGGFASNAHNNYIYSTVSQSLGTVAAIAGRAPSTPSTHAGATRMAGGQLRYFSICSNDANSQRYFDCAYDEQIARDAHGRFVLAVSRAADRPANARAECGVTWLNWGPLVQSLLIYRNMLAAAPSAFPQAIQYIAGPAGTHEVETMGAYFPYGMHTDQAGFESLGCPVNPDAIPKRTAQN